MSGSIMKQYFIIYSGLVAYWARRLPHMEVPKCYITPLQNHQHFTLYRAAHICLIHTHKYPSDP